MQNGSENVLNSYKELIKRQDDQISTLNQTVKRLTSQLETANKEVREDLQFQNACIQIEKHGAQGELDALRMQMDEKLKLVEEQKDSQLQQISQ